MMREKKEEKGGNVIERAPLTLMSFLTFEQVILKKTKIIFT